MPEHDLGAEIDELVDLRRSRHISDHTETFRRLQHDLGFPGRFGRRNEQKRLQARRERAEASKEAVLNEVADS